MNYLDYIGVPKNQQKKYIKSGLENQEDFLYFFPRKRRKFFLNTPYTGPNTDMCIYGFFSNYKEYDSVVMATLFSGSVKFTISWFHMNWITKRLDYLKGKNIYVCGAFTYNPQYKTYQCTNPVFFTDNGFDIKSYYPVYSQPNGLKQETFQKYIWKSTQLMIPDIIPEELRKKYQICNRYTAFYNMHITGTLEGACIAQNYFIIESLYKYAQKMKNFISHHCNESIVRIKDYPITKKIIDNLPFQLTGSQKNISSDLLLRMKNSSSRVNSLVQGDVSCGKTLIAQILMMAVAENGYQTALIAPTTVLAEQHYTKLLDLVKNDSIFKCLFIKGKMSAKEKRECLSLIKENKVNIVIGTTALLNMEFANLGLLIVDEEHRFGVNQKTDLAAKGNEGIHTVYMSATPIPRSLAQVIYAGTMSVENVTDMPPGRIPVKTNISTRNDAFKMIQEERAKGYKTYVICPKIEHDEKSEKISVEQAYKTYTSQIGTEKVQCVTGKMKVEEIQASIKDFRDGKFDVLISTTVVEVGVDVSDATLIIVENADMFGLSQLHQLRGRVGRAGIASTCLLIPSDKAKEKALERLQTLCDTNDGFKIASADLEMRGPGEILGTEQSGENVELEMSLKYPNTFAEIMEYVKKED